MNKADLKAKWGKYCDTDKLVVDMMALLKNYRHRCSEHGVCELLNEYFKNKEPLIKIIASSKNYIGDMRISLEKEFERKISSSDINGFLNHFESNMHLDMIMTEMDQSGKTMKEYLPIGKMLFNLNELPSKSELSEKVKNLRKFNYYNGYIEESIDKYNNARSHIRRFKDITTSILQRDFNYNGVELKHGTKTSRAFNKVCVHYGVDKLNPQTVQVEENGVMVDKVVYPYNKLFAYYSDLVSGLVRKMKFIISVNPLDYLTMSLGVSWRSCHMIDGGMRQGGCISYLLDKTSIITFVIDDMDTPIHTTPKLYRQMFHYGDDLFVQNRLYPQGNDGATNLYDKFREFVIEEFSDLLKVERKWKVECGAVACKKHILSLGSHYQDYAYNNSCNVFYPEKKNDVINHIITIGHDGICTHCGRTFNNGGHIAHAQCSIQYKIVDDFDWF